LSETDNNSQGQKVKTSKLALLSLVFSVLLFLGALCVTVIVYAAFDELVFAPLICLILGIIFSVISFAIIKKRRARLTSIKLTIAGILITTISAVILVYGSLVVKGVSELIICSENLRGLGTCIMIYNSDKDGYPEPNNWNDALLDSNLASEEVFVCWGLKGKERCSYAMNPNAKPDWPLDMVLLFETKGGWNQYGGPELITLENHKGKGCNILFNSGHVEFVIKEQLGKLKWTDEQKQ
jgi:hypothetical protein